MDQHPRYEDGMQQDCKHRKCLHELPLPKGVRLVYPRPTQRRMGGILVWAFELVFDGDTRIGPVNHVERYEQGIADQVQMRWALDALKARVAVLQAGKTGGVASETWTGESFIASAKRNFGLNISRMAQRYAVPL